MKKYIFYVILPLLVVSVSFSGCKKDDDDPATSLFFSVNDDVQFGLDFKEQLEANPEEYPLLDPVQYADAYNHIYRIRDSIISSGLVDYTDDFSYEVYIVDNDDVLNAFAVPGGYLYFYTGIIKFLDNEAQFAGVMGHEIAHVAKRHSIKRLEKAYGIQLLFAIILGDNPSAMAQIAADLAAGLSSLAFSRNDEYQADEFSVKYLYNTSYDATGIAGFFTKMENAPQPPEFLSTHPSPDNRMEEIYTVWEELGGKEGNTYEASYQHFINSLP